MSPVALVSGGGHQDQTFQQPLLDRLLAALNECGAGSCIDLCVSFIRQSGLVLLRDALNAALMRGASLRVITSDYLEVTEPVALRELLKFAPAQCDMRIYASQHNVGFHLKSYLFIHQDTPQHLHAEAFVGSSNISRAALSQSLEWNWHLHLDGSPEVAGGRALHELAEQVAVLAADPRVVPLNHAWIDDYCHRYNRSHLKELRLISGQNEYVEAQIIPNPIQTEVLHALAANRKQGFQRGLVVLATGLGKTYLAAFDVKQMQAARVLFVAHREEILAQAAQSFAAVAPNAQIGFYAPALTEQPDWLFASIQTLGRSNHLQRFHPNHFDYIVVDEFHHAAAPSYRRLLNHFQPRFLLGLTATPDRTDNADILALCDDNLIFECHLGAAIRQGYLVPLVYHGIEDCVDYRELPWRNGRFDPASVEGAFATQKRAQHVLHHWQQLRQSRTLAFCVSTKHADFMADFFCRAGIKAVAVYAGSAQNRQQALIDLANQTIEVIFSVDLFNEGTDLPAIDTVLMLRPTESRIIFLQQLGRGLRRFAQKQRLHVIDFVGNHRVALQKPQLLTQSLGGVAEPRAPYQISNLPDGCHINLTPAVLDLIERLKQNERNEVTLYRQLREELGYPPTALQAFNAGINLGKLRQQAGSWFAFLQSEDDLTPEQSALLPKVQEFLLSGIEATAMNKSFKAILLQAFLELDGFQQPPSLAKLAQQSHHLLQRHPDLYATDLPDAQQQLSGNSKEWLSYWMNNPIKHSTTGSKGSSADYWFAIRAEHFVSKLELSAAETELLQPMLQELIDLRLAQYRRRLMN